VATGRTLGAFALAFEPPPPFRDSLVQRFPEVDFPVATGPDRASVIAGADAMLAWNLDGIDIDLAPALRWIQWAGAGVDGAPLDLLEARGILLTNNRGVHATNIAEHVLAMMLGFCRALPYLVRCQARSEWCDDAGRRQVRELAGSRLLVVGAGNIGLALARGATALGQEVTVVGRIARSQPRLVSAIHDLDTLLPGADHVAICLPLTLETDRLFDRERIARMKPGAFLFNIGRGRIVDTDALLEALSDGRLAGAGLDVTDPEPPPPGHPLWTLPNVLLTAHTAGATPRYWERALDILVENIERFRRGDELRNTVSYDLGY
jgi:phosphoglycerate dehydrogenase-like enzyme